MNQCLCGIKISLEGNFWSRIKCWQEQKKETFWNEHKQDVTGFWINAFELSACNLRSSQSSPENLVFRTFKLSEPFTHLKNENKTAQINF